MSYYIKNIMLLITCSLGATSITELAAMEKEITFKEENAHRIGTISKQTAHSNEYKTLQSNLLRPRHGINFQYINEYKLKDAHTNYPHLYEVIKNGGQTWKITFYLNALNFFDENAVDEHFRGPFHLALLPDNVNEDALKVLTTTKFYCTRYDQPKIFNINVQDAHGKTALDYLILFHFGKIEDEHYLRLHNLLTAHGATTNIVKDDTTLSHILRAYFPAENLIDVNSNDIMRLH